MRSRSAAREFDRLVTALGERERYLLHARILPDTRLPVSRCADLLGISNVRVSQSTTRLRERLRREFASSPALRSAFEEPAEAARPVAALDRVLAASPALTGCCTTIGSPLWSALVAVDHRIDVVEGWVVAESVDTARTRTLALLTAAADGEGIVDLDSCASVLGMPRGEATTWLSHCGYRTRGDYVMLRSKSVQDNAAALLTDIGRPMTPEQIRAALVPTRSLSTVRNALIADPRFRRTDRLHWALTRWDTATYQPIHRRIGRLLDDNGGSMRLTDLVETISSAGEVKPESVRTYAKTGEFTTVAGVVRRRPQGFAPRKSPTRTRGLYREGSTVRLRITLKGLHLKGSAFHCPSALAGLLGVGSERNAELSSRLGAQSVRWIGFQAKLGSIRRFADDLGLGPGEEVFLVFDLADEHDHRIDVVPAPHGPASEDQLRDVVSATGHSRAAAMPAAELARTLAEALWLAPDTGLAEIRAALRRRDEHDLADRLEGTHLP